MKFVYFLPLLLMLACEKNSLDSLEADSAEEFNASVRAFCDSLSSEQSQIACYSREIRQRVEQYWFFPKESVKKQYRSRVRVYLDTLGYPLKLEFLERSASYQFNDSIVQAIERAKPLPIPQNEALYTYQFSDVTLFFEPHNTRN